MTTNTAPAPAPAAGQASTFQHNSFRNGNSHGQLDVHYRLANTVPAPSVPQKVEETNNKIKGLGFKPVSVDLEHNKMMQDLDELA
ncbi:hypothetical protein NW752_011628 [Fusarium irregulare]|uniref:Uncharacterized protein n=1 Tax=Fusarium irregulare TaxID=2494466 RepID=A0A9W8PDR9_9HYPO|nr:hypothetical protein NW766_012515 [Fusarium irregulare]KAJ4004531.1 hypothetical protein NW752_011628 [Fusarium irregulare]